MGLEATCTARLNGEPLGEGKAHCGDLELTFRGEKRVKFFWKDISHTSAKGDVFSAESNGDVLELDLGDKAVKWVLSIKNPKPLIEKFGLKPEHSYATIGNTPDWFDAYLQESSGRIGEAPYDVVFVCMESAEDLSLLDQVRSQINKDGMVWVIYPKGQKHFKESDIRGCARESGWVDVKIASVDDVLTSVKLVIPKQLR